MRVYLVIACALALAGCQTDGVGVITTLTPVCDALIGPIPYNTYKKTSPRYAGPALAVDLQQRNQVGQRLNCPQYANPPRAVK
jgi:hypothetical protein